MGHQQPNDFSAIATSLLREHKLATPFLFMDEQRLVSALSHFKKHLPKVRLFYAMKSNPSSEVIRFFLKQGLSLDVASAGEIEDALAQGASGKNLLLTTPIKTEETIRAIFRHGVAAFVVDNVGELERISAYRLAHRISSLPKVFIRIRVESKGVEHDLNTKFGCAPSETLEIAERLLDLGFEIGGICFHVGTQSVDASNYLQGIETAILVAKNIQKKYRVKIPVINIGGGFCDPEVAEKAGLDLEDFYSKIGAACNLAAGAGFEVYAEPGRCLVSGAGAVVTSVIGSNVRNGQRWIYLNDGIYGCFSIKLYESREFQFLPIKSLTRTRMLRGKSKIEKCTVAGPSCDSLDVIAEGIELPTTIASGDTLLTPNLGAYSVATASAFNGFPVPKCRVVRVTKQSGKALVALPYEVDDLTAAVG